MATITPEQRSEVLKVVVGLFNAAPGGVFMNDLAGAVEGGMSTRQVADFLAAHPIFTNEVLAGKVTVGDQVNLLMNNFGLTASSDPASAGAIAADFFKTSLEAGKGFGEIVTEAATYLSSDTTPAEFQATKNLFLNKVAVAERYSLSSNSTDLNTLQNSLSQVKGDHLYTAAEAQQLANTASANSFALTTDSDIIEGTAANDIVFGDPGTTMQAADIVNGGSGYDILKALGTLTGEANLPGTMTGVEALQITKLGDADLNLSAFTKATTGLTNVVVADASLLGTGAARTITTTDGQSLSLATAGGAATADGVTWAGSNADTSLNLTLNGYQGAAPAPEDLDVEGNAATTLNINSIGADNKIGELVAADATTQVITGDKGLSYATSGVLLEKIDASAATGNINVEIITGINSDLAFTGGSGNDTIKLANDAFGTLTAGTQLDGGAGTDKLSIFDTDVSASEAAKINAAQNFESLSLNGANLTLSASTVSNFKTFDIDTTALTTTINNIATGSTVNVGAGATAAFTQTELTLGGVVGVTDIAVNLGDASDTFDHTITSLRVTGLTNVDISSNGTGVNAIAAVVNSDNTTFTLTGAADLTMVIGAGTSTGSQIDASAMTGVADLEGSDFGDIIKGGSADDLLYGGEGTDTMTGGAGADTFNFAGAAGATTSGPVLGNFDTITDFVAGTDKLQFSGVVDVVSGQQTAVQSAVTALAAGSTAAQIATAMATANTTNLGVSFAVYEGNTYALYETAGAGTGVAADDVFVQLAGVTTAPTFAADVIA